MKIHLVSLGCPKNTVDSEWMLGLLQQAGHRMVPEADDADLVIVNTCGFIEPAKQESLDALMEALDLKKARPAVKVIAAGCLTQRYREELPREIPELDALIGVTEIPGIAGLVEGLPLPEPPAAPYLPSGRGPAPADHPPALRLREGRGGLLPPLHLLRHPGHPRPAAQPAAGGHPRRDRRPGRRGRPGDPADRPGHHRLRARPPRRDRHRRRCSSAPPPCRGISGSGSCTPSRQK